MIEDADNKSDILLTILSTDCNKVMFLLDCKW